MTCAVLTCNIGNSDEIFPLAKQTADYELFYYTESTLPFPLPNLDNRMKGKYLKTQTHRFLDHDIFIWIDASIEVINKDFVQICIDQLKNQDIVIAEHSQRKSVYEELVYIIDRMKQGDRYLLKRYARQPFYAEYDFYKDNKFPKEYPLYQCNFFARWNNELINNMFNYWWDLNIRFSNFDQCAFSFAAWIHEIKINVVETEDLFIRNKHPGYNL